VKIVQLTPGTGGFYCGSCIRDNALVRGLRERGHDALLVPLYLPHVVDEENASRGTPIALGGINMYLQQISGVFRRTPRWIDRLLDGRWLLGLAARRATMTKPESLGEMTLSTLRGESGHQAKEIDRLARWLAREGTPDVVCLSNVLLVGLVRTLRERLGPVKIVCTLHGEDAFLDSLPEPHRSQAWDLVAERCRDLDALLPVSHYYADLMTERLGLDPERVRPVHNGIDVEGYEPAPSVAAPPAVGFLARMTPAKGLETLVDAFLALKRDAAVPDLRLHVAGSHTPADRAFTRRLEERIGAAGQSHAVSWQRNISRDEKLAFLRGLSVLSVPATYGEAFGLYVLEALAAGVPVVQPRHGAFPELLAELGGGVLCEPDKVDALAGALTDLLSDPARARSLGAEGRQAVLDRFTLRHMTERVLEVFAAILGG
jgi:glycosyltransferase involved in cell wall biosynthesis